jgi:NAD+ diphosphatase
VKKQCSGVATKQCRESNYPRTDPVIISLVQSADGQKVLLARSHGFPPGYYSCVAGFLEGGESIEEAVRREVNEEVGLLLGPKVRYASSQPWPLGRGLFNQVMIGCLATAEGSEIKIDPCKLSPFPNRAEWCPLP